MGAGRRSITALGVAVVRAAHQERDGGAVFADPLAGRLVAADGTGPAFEATFDVAREPVRLVVAARARFAEDALLAAVADGVRQAVVLGAGLDTFAYRHGSGDEGLRVFEVDRPATQEWKRSLLARAGIAEPPSLTFAPIDFEESGLSAGLARAGFDPDRAAFFVWIGVVPYLTPDAVLGTLGLIGSLPAGSGVVFDYMGPRETMAADQRAAFEARAAWAAGHGEPFVSHFVPGDLVARVRDLGFSRVGDITYEDLAARYGSDLAGPGPGSSAHVLRAEV
jgi:methyltransferase (TIGR00027 family)